jgi:hypothetical protein
MAQDEGPEFKPQYCKQTNKKETGSWIWQVKGSFYVNLKKTTNSYVFILIHSFNKHHLLNDDLC